MEFYSIICRCTVSRKRVSGSLFKSCVNARSRGRVFVGPLVFVHQASIVSSFLRAGLWIILWLLCAIKIGGWRCTQ